MTQATAQQINGWAVVNIDAAGSFADSDLAAYLDGYGDGMAHTFHIERGATDTAYFNGYMKAVNDERRQADEQVAQNWRDAERDEVWQQRNGWQL
jgi:hypothetical protein